ncbi:ATP-dependent helicase [Candidatus Omnitrophota bacterium]
MTKTATKSVSKQVTPTEHIILEGLNPQQTEAVIHQEGPLLIIAGAGTGKTTVITRRIAYLIETGKAKTNEILALTFTDKAATEMQERVDVLVPYGYTDIWISTFHAFGDRVLREQAIAVGLNPEFKVLTRPETNVFLREHIFDFPLDLYRPLSDPTRFINAMIALFSRAKDEDISTEEYLNYAAGLKNKAAQNPDDSALQEEAARQDEIAHCYALFQDLLAKEGKVDFGNQFYLTLQLLRTHPDILKKCQQQFKYILVDEFQDTNYAQFELVKLLAAGHKNLTVVADDDQSIYKWRGAAISNILNFMDAYPESEKVSLTQNYRSTQTILDRAYQLIQYNNPDRLEVKAGIDKHLKGISKKGKAVEHCMFDTLSSEADYVSNTIKKKVKSQECDYSDCAILVRSNSASDPFLRALNMNGIPWRFSGNQGLYTREEVRLCISFLRFIANLSDSLSLYYLASSEVYGMPIADLTRCMNFASRQNLTLYYVFQKLSTFEKLTDISKEAQAVIERVLKDIGEFLEASRTHTTGRLLYRFLTETGYIEQLVKNPSIKNERKIRNIAKFFDMVRNFELVAREDRVMYFVRYLNMLIEAGDDPATVEPDLDISAVNVLTLHKAKGLEFDVVFLVGLVTGRFPTRQKHETIELPVELIKDILPSGDFHIQEERRLFYVGMTRAKKELYLTAARDYGTIRTRKVSQFVLEALGIQPAEEIKKTAALEAIHRHAPPAETSELPVARVIPDDQVVTLSYYQVDDYLTCPLKYKYVHILRVPILQHHVVLYGKALHDAVQFYFQNKLNKKKVNENKLLSVFEDSLTAEGFLSQEHYTQRLQAGEAALRKFFIEQQQSKIAPKFVEKEFSFMLGTDKVVGRWDRVDERKDGVVIIDFKSSQVIKQKDADKRTKETIQLAIYSLAFKQIFGIMPFAVELHFLETGLVGRCEVSEQHSEKAVEKIKSASEGIRKARFDAQPTYFACSSCAYNQICPSAIIRRA